MTYVLLSPNDQPDKIKPPDKSHELPVLRLFATAIAQGDYFIIYLDGAAKGDDLTPILNQFFTAKRFHRLFHRSSPPIDHQRGACFRQPMVVY